LPLFVGIDYYSPTFNGNINKFFPFCNIFNIFFVDYNITGLSDHIILSDIPYFRQEMEKRKTEKGEWKRS